MSEPIRDFHRVHVAWRDRDGNGITAPDDGRVEGAGAEYPDRAAAEAGKADVERRLSALPARTDGAAWEVIVQTGRRDNSNRT